MTREVKNEQVSGRSLGLCKLGATGQIQLPAGRPRCQGSVDAGWGQGIPLLTSILRRIQPHWDLQ